MSNRNLTGQITNSSPSQNLIDGESGLPVDPGLPPQNLGYQVLTENTTIASGKTYITKGSSRLILNLVAGQTGDSLGVYSDSVAGFTVRSPTKIKQLNNETLVNGYVNSVELGTQIRLERSPTDWLLIIESGTVEFF